MNTDEYEQGQTAHIRFEGYDIWLHVNQSGDIDQVVAPPDMPKDVLERLEQQRVAFLTRWLRGEREDAQP